MQKKQQAVDRLDESTSHLKKRILVQDNGGGGIYTGGILQYAGDLNFASSKDMGPTGILGMP